MTGRDAPPASAADGGAASTPAHAPAPTARGGWRAWAELLRAPLLLSPIADVLAGWSVGFAALSWFKPLGGSVSASGDAVFETAVRDTLPGLALAGASGLCLLAAGMAQNALADRSDDVLRKPTRPLPRGALTAAAVGRAWAVLTASGLLLAATVGSLAFVLAVSIVLLTALYHFALKSFRVPGCLALGALRGLDLLLGFAVVAAWHGGDFSLSADAPFMTLHPSTAVTFAVIYAGFMFGASLHASIDDQAASSATRRTTAIGAGLQCLALLLLTWYVYKELWLEFDDVHRLLDDNWVFAYLPAIAAARLLVALARLPSGPLTGVMLSGLYLFNAGACLSHQVASAGVVCASVVLLLFGASRLMKRAFPPT